MPTLCDNPRWPPNKKTAKIKKTTDFDFEAVFSLFRVWKGLKKYVSIEVWFRGAVMPLLDLKSDQY